MRRTNELATLLSPPTRPRPSGCVSPASRLINTSGAVRGERKRRLRDSRCGMPARSASPRVCRARESVVGTDRGAGAGVLRSRPPHCRFHVDGSRDTLERD
jgi:hypothetical protein